MRALRIIWKRTLHHSNAALDQAALRQGLHLLLVRKRQGACLCQRFDAVLHVLANRALLRHQLGFVLEGVAVDLLVPTPLDKYQDQVEAVSES